MDPYQRIYSTIRQIPSGRVATYGQVAAVAGLAGHARQVGYALSVLADDHDVPWHRVINAKGEISTRSFPLDDDGQRQRLEAEGVEFSPLGRVSLARYRWRS